MTVLPFVAHPVGDIGAARDVANRAAHRLALGDVTLLRVGTNALFAADGHVILRVGRCTTSARAVVDLVALLARAGVAVPAVRGIVDDLHPQLSVVVLERIDATSGAVDWGAVGAAVRVVHGLDRGAVAAVYPLPTCTVFGHWRFEQLYDDVVADLGDAERRAVRSAVDWLGDWADRAERVPHVVCHGDVHPGNVLMAARGPVLLDWDMMCRAPAAWDHAALLTWEHRWGGDAGTYASFAAGYGADLSDDPLARVLAEGRLLAATLMRCRAGRADAAAAEEARRRLRYWLGDPDAPTWRAV